MRHPERLESLPGKIPRNVVLQDKWSHDYQLKCPPSLHFQQKKREHFALVEVRYTWWKVLCGHSEETVSQSKHGQRQKSEFQMQRCGFENTALHPPGSGQLGVKRFNVFIAGYIWELRLHLKSSNLDSCEILSANIGKLEFGSLWIFQGRVFWSAFPGPSVAASCHV